ncbi:MAG: 6-bladed beta-propeller [Candidatus Aminicenantes bacterium]|nr:6-bladed beta-propeller [Candidatus Aminicenantes bacterium]
MKTKTKIVSIVLFLSAFMMHVSCGKQKAGWKGTIEEENGVTIVRNPKEGLWDSKEKANVTIIKERQIGELDGPEEFLFVYISDIAVNSKGDIYVADRQLNEVRKFNKDGEYLLTLGRRGQGPGEFQNVKIVSVNINNDLIAFDSMLRRINIFSDKGELIKTTKKLMVGSWVEPSKIFVIDGNYVFFGKLSNSLKLFHEFGQDWNITESYIDYEFIDNKEFEEHSFGFFPGNCFFQNNGDILYTKYYYDNQIFIYKNKELEKIIGRESDIKKPYEIQVFRDVNKAMNIKRDQDYDFKSFGQGIAFVGKSFQNSLGIFQLSDGLIVNFLAIRKSKGNWEFGVELFDSSGKLLSYSKIGENLYYNVRCMDSNDLFYAIERKEYNKVIMFRLRY